MLNLKLKRGKPLKRKITLGTESFKTIGRNLTQDTTEEKMFIKKTERFERMNEETEYTPRRMSRRQRTIIDNMTEEPIERKRHYE